MKQVLRWLMIVTVQCVQSCVWLLPVATEARQCALQQQVSLRRHAELCELQGCSSTQQSCTPCLAWPHLPCRCCPCSLCTAGLAWLAMPAVE